MTLRIAVQALHGRPGMMLPTVGLQTVPEVAVREQEVAARFGLGRLLAPPPDLDEVAVAIRSALSSGDFGGLERRQIKYAPLCIWECATPLAESRDLLLGLLDYIARASRRSLIRTLAAVYFRAFRPSRPGIDLVGQALTRMVGPEMQFLKAFHDTYAVFDPDRGPLRVADQCLRSGILPQALLRKHGLSGPALTSGFGASCYRAGMERLRNALTKSPHANLVAAARHWTDEPVDTPYKGARKTFAETLLLPFEAREPDGDLRSDILDMILERVGDPRTRPQNWVQMQAAAAVAKRWLTHLALRQFLEIVDETAYQNQWEYRRAFWMAYYERGAISDAWVAFAPRGAERARQLFGAHTSFGRLRATWKPVENGHAVLLMRIGDLVVIDWSHNGRCIVWPVSDQECPVLYKQIYHSGDLAPRVAPKGGMEKSHGSSQSYQWQRAIAAFIRDKTGIALHDNDFLVT